MSNNEDNFSTNVGILKYRLDELEKLVKTLIDLVNNLDKKVSLLAQKIVIATVIIGGAFQLVGIWYGSHLSNQQSASEKASNYDYRLQESKTIEELKREIELLKRNAK
jgi:hypothetical protein